MLTQPLPRVHALADRVAGLGLKALVLPFSTIETVPFASEVAHARSLLLGSQGGGAAALHTTPAWDVVVFVSPGAVMAFSAGTDLARWPSQTGIAIVGPGTLETLQAACLPESVSKVLPTSGQWDADGLLAALASSAARPRRLLVVCGENARTHWVERLGDLGISVEILIAYRRVPTPAPCRAVEQFKALCCEAVPWVGVVTLGQTAVALAALSDSWPPDAVRWMHSQCILTIHPRIEKALETAGFRAVIRIAPGVASLDGALSSGLWLRAQP